MVSLHPVLVSSATIASLNQVCPSGEAIDAAKETLKSEIKDVLQDRGLRTVCPCGGPGIWRRIAFLNMSNASEECPQNWTRTYARDAPVVGCGRSTEAARTCDSTF